MWLYMVLVIKFEQTIICGRRLHIGQTREIRSMIMFTNYPCKVFPGQIWLAQSILANKEQDDILSPSQNVSKSGST